jgi:hypothetical protein
MKVWAIPEQRADARDCEADVEIWIRNPRRATKATKDLATKITKKHKENP